MPIHGNPEWQCFFSIFLRFLPYSSKLLKSPQKIFFIFPLDNLNAFAYNVNRMT